jgi:2-dehydropantoate 2-reductase
MDECAGVVRAPPSPGRNPKETIVDLTIVGAGAIGGITGAHLARAGHHVQLVERDQEHAEAIRRDGLQVGGKSEFSVRVPVFFPDEVPAPIGVLILAVKTLHTREALEPLVPLLSEDGYVVSMQNGLEEAKIAALVGSQRTVGAFLTFGGYFDRPGRLIYSGPGSLRVGELHGRITPRVQELAQVLSDFHPAEPTENIQGFLWGKLVLSTMYFATATVDANVVDIVARPECRRVLAELVAEALRVADALGIRVEPVDGFNAAALRSGAETPEAIAAWRAQVAYWNRGVSTRTGVWRDLAVRRRRTEAGPILGALLEAAQTAGLAVPHAQRLVHIIRGIEDGRRRMDWANLTEIGSRRPPTPTSGPR